MSNKGFSIIELLVTAAIGVISALGIANYLVDINRIHEQMKLRRLSGEVVHAYAESMRFNLSLFQVSFDNSIQREKTLLRPDVLPLGLSKGKVVPRSLCKTEGCQAYMGYVIIPSEFVRNLYQVKFVVVAMQGAEIKWEQEYTYFITVK